MATKTKILLAGLVFPEGPRWHDGKLWFSDMHAQRVMTVDLKGKTEIIVAVPHDPSGLGWDKDGKLLVVSMTDRQLLRLDPKGLKTVADLSKLASGDCNDMVVDKKGRAYIGNFGKDTNLGKDFHVGPAEIIMVTPDGKARVVADNMVFPNGMVITPDDKTLIVAESFGGRLTAFSIAKDGSLTGRRVWAALAKGIDPDGICLDADGAVWVADAAGHAVSRVKEGGEVLQQIGVETHAYACMLGGNDRRTLFVLTAAATGGPACRKLMSGRIETVKVDVPGEGLP
jgi:sugar lactone lactonase YvrE